MLTKTRLYVIISLFVIGIVPETSEPVRLGASFGEQIG